MGLYEQGLLLENGGHISRDKSIAADCYRQAVESGDTRAMFRLALLEMEKDPVSMADLMQRAAYLGNNDAAYWLARNYFYESSLPKDYDKSFFWLNELSRRNGLTPKARFLLGLCYYNGYGTAVDYGAAVQTLLGALESSGLDRWGGPVPDSTIAEEKATAGLGAVSIRTICHILGECYYYGRGVGKDYCRALKYLLLSVQDGEYVYPNKEAEYLIGTCYYFHLGTKQDIPTALYWLRDADKQGSAKAKELLDKRARRKRK